MKNGSMTRESHFIYSTNIFMTYYEPRHLYKEVLFCTNGAYTLVMRMNQVYKKKYKPMNKIMFSSRNASKVL